MLFIRGYSILFSGLKWNNDWTFSNFIFNLEVLWVEDIELLRFRLNSNTRNRLRVWLRRFEWNLRVMANIWLFNSSLCETATARQMSVFGFHYYGCKNNLSLGRNHTSCELNKDNLYRSKQFKDRCLVMIQNSIYKRHRRK